MSDQHQNLVPIRDLCQTYNIGEKAAVVILGKYGEIYNIKLLFYASERVYVPRELFTAMSDADENINQYVLPIPEEMAESIPVKKGNYIYFLFTGESLVYIGQTVTLVGRLGTHYKDKEFDHFAYIEVEHKKIDIIESVNILHYKPTLNCLMKDSTAKFKLLVQNINVEDLKCSF